MNNLVFLTGAGISQESGLATFRDVKNGLWNNYKIDDVASVWGWNRDPAQVIKFYNERRREASRVVPNDAHIIAAELQDKFNVTVCTQNVDNLHERAGSKLVYHVHGNLMRVREEIKSKNNPIVRKILDGDLHVGDVSVNKIQFRPDVVFFGEDVQEYFECVDAVKNADILIIVGTSLLVFPFNELHRMVKPECKKFMIDINPPFIGEDTIYVNAKATDGMKTVRDMLLHDLGNE